MAADPGKPRFFFDESVLGVAKAIARARRDVVHPGHRLLPSIPPGTLDPVWMPIVADLGLVVIARDRRIRTRPGSGISSDGIASGPSGSPDDAAGI
jgi:hypothetical protein